MKWYPMIQRDLGLLIQSCHAWNQKASSVGSRSNRLILFLLVILVINLFYKGDMSGSRGGGGAGDPDPPPEKSQK